MLHLMKSRRLSIVFMLGIIMLNYPVLSLFNIPRFLFGIPLLYLYLFGTWVVLILLTVIISVSNIKPPPPPGQV